jgi:hypothetical protein
MLGKSLMTNFADHILKSESGSFESDFEWENLSVGSLVTVIREEDFFEALWDFTDDEGDENFIEDMLLSVSLKISWMLPSIK